MRPLRDYFNKKNTAGPWVLAGKGPSFADRPAGPLAYPVFGLNDVCRFADCAVAHFTDFEAYTRNEGYVAIGGGAVVLPWHPHLNNVPGPMSLEELVAGTESLRSLKEQGRLFSYNSHSDKKPRARLSTHTVRYFSAVVGLHILSSHGVREVLTLGIDGGTKYAPEFDTHTLLSNGRASFDSQFREMTKIRKKYGVRVVPYTPRST